MAGFYSLVIQDLLNSLNNWWYKEPPIPIDEPLQSPNPIWINEIRPKFAVWIIEGAYLRYKYLRRKRCEDFDRILAANINYT